MYTHSVRVSQSESMMFQVPSYHRLPHTRGSSPHRLDSLVTSPPPHVTPDPFSHPQVTSPPAFHETHVSSPPFLPYQSSNTPPHCQPWPQTTYPHLLIPPHPPPSQVTHLHQDQPHINTSHHFLQGQVTSPPHLSITSPHLGPQPQMPSPHIVAQSQISPSHLLSPSQFHIYNQNRDPGFGNGYQNTAHLELQNQNQMSVGVTHHRDGLENTPRLSYNNSTLVPTDIYEQSHTLGPGHDTWRPLEPTVAQLQGSPQVFMSGDMTLGSWTSMLESNSPPEDSSRTQFYQYDALQPFCSPNTPGPSPHYPHTPSLSSPGPQMHHTAERPDFHKHTTGQLSGDETLGSCQHEYSGYQMIFEQLQLSQTNQQVHQSGAERIQDRTCLFNAAGNAESCFPPEGVSQGLSSTNQSPGLPAGPRRREGSYRGKGRGRGRGKGDGNGQRNTTQIKQQASKKPPEVPDSRLLCVVCTQTFRNLSALSQHTRSHNSSKSASCLNKGEDPSFVMTPVPGYIQSRGPASYGQQICVNLPPATRHPVLYRSLLHQDEEEHDEGGGGDDAHYIPPPMLCPLRAGPGLYCSLITRRHPRLQTVQLYNSFDDPVALETAPPPPGTLTTGINKPRINIGRVFQAEIPHLGDQKYTHVDSHNAMPLWTPCEELNSPVNQQRAEALSTMARSSVVPGGGVSPESALHVLSEFKGDFLLTLEELLSPSETTGNCKDRQSKNVTWSTAERRLLVQSLQRHHKDFGLIQKAVRTKSRAQCVEFYYLWKKKLSRRNVADANVTNVRRRDGVSASNRRPLARNRGGRLSQNAFHTIQWQK